MTEQTNTIKGYNSVELAKGHIDHELVKKARDYLYEKGKRVLGSGKGNIVGSPGFVAPGGNEGHSVYYDIYHLPDINAVAVLEQMYDDKNPEPHTELRCEVHGEDNETVNNFLDELVLNLFRK